MALEHWELIKRQEGNIAAANAAKRLRKKFGDVPLPNENVTAELSPADNRRIKEILGDRAILYQKDAIQAILRADLEAERVNHGYIGTEHCVLGLIQDEGDAGVVLEELGVGLREARIVSEFIVGDWGARVEEARELSPYSKKVLATLEAPVGSSNKPSIGALDMLLSIGGSDCLGAGVLEYLGVTAPRLLGLVGKYKAAPQGDQS